VIDAQFARSDSGYVSAQTVSAGERSERPSLAVLPLALLGKATDDQGLCLGFADALVALLGNLRDVSVLPTSPALDAPAQASAADTASRL
jgi:TolB-like protein